MQGVVAADAVAVPVEAEGAVVVPVDDVDVKNTLAFRQSKRRAGKLTMARKKTQRRKKRSGKLRRGGARRGQRGGAAKKFKHIIRRLRRMKGPQQLRAMKKANGAFIRHMCREVKKLQYKRLPKGVETRMRRNSKKIRQFVSPKTSIDTKRRMISQRGGLLGTLLAGLAPTLLAALFGGR